MPIRYVDIGAGTPIVLVHGYTRSLELEFMDTGMLQNLAADHRVIAFDLRGHGRSGKPHDSSAYGEQMVQDIVRLLDHLQVRRSHIVGYSLGAAIAAKVVTTNPERFITATLGGAAGARSWSREQAASAERAAVELESGTPFRSVILATAPADEPAPSEDEILRRSEEMVATNDPLALAAFNRRRDELVVTPEQIAALRLPLLALIGSADANLASMRFRRSSWSSSRARPTVGHDALMGEWSSSMRFDGLSPRTRDRWRSVNRS